MYKINSFDIFDTLLARRCVEAQNIFHELEKFSGIEKIAAIRLEAEKLIGAKEYSIDDIYNQISKMIDISPEEIQALKALEVSLEVKNAIPIATNISKVNDGDILISDMYLHKKVIFTLLEKIELQKQISLFVSSHGKSQFKVWSPLQKKININLHSGDNSHSDVNSPGTYGINSLLVTNSQLNGHEKFFRENGLEQTARITRELRLTKVNAINGSAENRIKLNQFQNNFPLLLLSAAYIYHLARDLNIDKILFCSRDCYFIQRIFSHVFQNTGIEAEYFYTSRITRTKSSDDYIAYCNEMITDSSLIVDLCGTGWSLGYLFNKLGTQPKTLLIHELSDNNILKYYDSIKKFNRPTNLFKIINNPELDNSALELCNYTTHGMTIDVKEVPEIKHFHPMFENPSYSKPALNIINKIKECENEVFEVMLNYSLDELRIELGDSREKIPNLINELYKDLIKNKSLYEDLSNYHLEQDAKTMQSLAK